ncbi:MAG: DUF6973 domain-containing protein [Fimbriimonas sp.]
MRDAIAIKNGSSPYVHGSNYDLERTDEAAKYCEGGPPLLPYFGDIAVAEPPEELNAPSRSEYLSVPVDLGMVSSCVSAVKEKYPNQSNNQIFLNRVTFNTYRQTIQRSPRNPYDNATDAEKDILWENPLRYIGMHRCKVDAEAAVREYFTEDCDSDRGNAFKHAYWNIRLCAVFGEELAKRMADAHEDFPSNGLDTKAMDLHNNEVGRRLWRDVLSSIPGGDDLVLTAFVLLDHIVKNPTALVSYPDIPNIPNLVCLRSSCSEQIPPTPGAIVVSETDRVYERGQAGFFRAGTERYWKSGSVGYGGSTLWTMSNGESQDNSGYWTANLPVTGRYRVEVFIPSNYADTKNARYFIGHRDGTAFASVDQSIYFDRWVSLGDWTFDAGTSNFVTLNDVTGEPYNKRMIGFDAVQFIKL